MELTKSRHGGEAPFHTPSMVFYTELLKALVAFAYYGYQFPRLEYTGLENLTWRSCSVFAVPALLYAVQNNLNYVALKSIDPPTYQLWGCSKLIWAGVFFRLILGRTLTLRKWTALGLLAAGMAITTLHPAEDEQSSRAALGGIMLVLCTSSLSGLSSIFNEWLIKFQDPKAPLMFKNGMLYAFGVLMCIGSWKPSAPLGDPPLFLALVLVQACAGLCVSFVLKYCDSLVKGFSTSGAVILATALSAGLFNFGLRAPFLIGTSVVCGAFYLYFGV